MILVLGFPEWQSFSFYLEGMKGLCFPFPQWHTMDAASSLPSPVKAHKSLAVSNTYRLTNLSTFVIPSWMSTKPNMLRLHYSSNRKYCLNTLISFTRCSAKSDTNRDGMTDENSTFEPNLASQAPKWTESSAEDEPAYSSCPLLLESSTYSRGLIFDLGVGGSWDRAEIGCPVVKRFLSDEEERWYMWYYGRSDRNPGSDSIGLAVSSNGIHWERGGATVKSNGDVGLVMNCSNDWWAFDTESIRPSEIMVMSSTKVRTSTAVYWLYYTGYSSEKAEFCENSIDFVLENPDKHVPFDNENDHIDAKVKIYKSLPGLAISQDGRHWARIEGEHHSGALFDVGCDGEWDSLFIAAPHVVFNSNGDLRMYYHSFDVEKGELSIGLARSRDGIRWVKLGKIIGGGRTGAFDECGVMNACVVRNRKDGNYVMAYEGVSAEGKRSVGLAVSPDGLKEWRRLQDEAILKPSHKDCWDDKEVGYPCLVQMDTKGDEWRLYYRGVGCKGRTGIGMAASEGDLRNFDKWTGLHS